jgi:pyruvate/2-oxoglutarate dehydrogenase complex dihydrolipoamide acyltransferase (E2) component
MAVELTMPKFGLTMSEGNIVRWLKNEGDPVQENESVLEIETEKITVEIPAPVTGRLQKIVTPAGTVVPVGGVMAVIDPDK